MTDESMVYSDSLGQIIRSEKWYFLSFQKSELTHWNSNKISLHPSIYDIKKFPIRYTYGDDIYILFKSNTSFLAYRIVNGGRVSPKLIKFDKSFRNKLILSDNISIMDGQIRLTAQQKDAFQGALLVISLFISFLFLFLFLYHGRKEQDLMHLATLIIIGINLLVFYNLGIPFDDYFFLSNQNFDSLSNEHLLTILFIHLISVILISVSLIYVFRKIKTQLIEPIIIGILLFCLDFFINLSSNIITHVHILLDFERLVDFNIPSYILLLYICLCFILFWVTCFISKSKMKLHNLNHWIWFIIGVLIFTRQSICSRCE